MLLFSRGKIHTKHCSPRCIGSSLVLCSHLQFILCNLRLAAPCLELQQDGAMHALVNAASCLEPPLLLCRFGFLKERERKGTKKYVACISDSL